MSDADAVGSFIAGGLVAKEVSPAHGRHTAHAGEKYDECPNCGSASLGHYCPECGQHVHVARSVKDILHEAVHGVLHLDGKFWRTLPKLIFKPGELTRDYVEGKRARYVAPFGIFLFTVFAMYFTFAFVGPPGERAIDDSMIVDGDSGELVSGDEARAQVAEDLAAEIEELEDSIDELQDRREAIVEGVETAAPGELASINGQIRETRLSLRTAQRAQTAVITGEYDVSGQIGDLVQAAIDDANGTEELPSDPEVPVEDEAASTEGKPAAGDDTEAQGDAEPQREATRPENLNVVPGVGVTDGQVDFMGIEWLESRAEKTFENPELYFYKIKQSAYKYSFLLLPLSLPFVWLLFFWRRDLHLYDHTVFILYSLSFMSLLYIALWLGMATGIWGWAIFWTAGIFIPPIHMYKQLKYGYGLSRGGALLRTFVLTQFALIVLGLFVAIVMALGAL